MMSGSSIASFALALLVLLYSGGTLVRTLTWMGRYLRVSEYVLASILAAFATSLPELSIGIASAFTGAPAIALGDLVGANVLNVTVVLGVAAIAAGGLPWAGGLRRRDAGFTIMATALPALFAVDGQIGRADGVVLLMLFGGYILYLIREERVTPPVNSMPPEERSFRRFMRHCAVFAAAAAVLVLAAAIAVSSAEAIAAGFGLPLFVIGIFVAIGTTLPEMVFGVKAVKLGHAAMAYGNALGSVILNITAILGLVAVIAPVAVERPLAPMLGMLATTALVAVLQWKRMRSPVLSARAGLALIFGGVFFLLAQASLSRL